MQPSGVLYGQVQGQGSGKVDISFTLQAPGLNTSSVSITPYDTTQ